MILLARQYGPSAGRGESFVNYATSRAQVSASADKFSFFLISIGIHEGYVDGFIVQLDL
jgi:hypothetical protein